MTPQQIADLCASSPLAWVVLNKMLSENQKPLEFKNHRFLIDPFTDLHPDQVHIKSAQVGESVMMIFKSIWAASQLTSNVIYVLPSQNIVSDFVAPKVNPIIESNPVITAMLGKTDSESKKNIGKRFIYFRGAFSEREAISISGDILILDELDRMPNMQVVNTYDSRLQASELAWRWRLSNPSGVGFGVDALWNDSDQRHWMVKCQKCNHEWFMGWESDGQCHFIDRQAKLYVCGKCKQPLSDEDRRMGRWVRKYQDRERHGYWFSQMMVPNIPAKRIIEQYEDSNAQFFNNFVLGKAYTPSDLIVDRKAILRACAPSDIAKVNVVIGVDQKAEDLQYVCVTPQGMFDYGHVKSWEDIERMKLMYRATVVCDLMPYPVMPKKMAQKYPDWYPCIFKDHPGLDVWSKKDGVIYADRNKMFDILATEITQARFLFRQRPYELEAYIADWANLYRTTTERPDGKQKTEWLKRENKESDLSFCSLYARLGLAMTNGGSMQLFAPTAENPKSDFILPDGQLLTEMGKHIKEAFDTSL